MKYYFGSDHAGLELKKALIEHLKQKGLKTEDLGTHSQDSCDYPDYAIAVAEKVAKENALGILVCGTGIGICMSANKVDGIRAATIHNEFTGQMAKEHNNANIICLGGRVVDEQTAKKAVDGWLEAKFGEGRHTGRVKKIMDIEKH